MEKVLPFLMFAQAANSQLIKIHGATFDFLQSFRNSAILNLF